MISLTLFFTFGHVFRFTVVFDVMAVVRTQETSLLCALTHTIFGPRYVQFMFFWIGGSDLLLERSRVKKINLKVVSYFALFI